MELNPVGREDLEGWEVDFEEGGGGWWGRKQARIPIVVCFQLV